jgi:hypothetical protein
MSSPELDSAMGALSPVASNWWTDAWLAFKPRDQLCFKRTGRRQWCDPAKRQTVVFCQSFYRILAQSKKSCDYSQLQPSIRQVVIRTFHPSHVYIPSRQAPLRSPQADPQWTRGGSCLVLRISLDSKNQLEISHGKA